MLVDGVNIQLKPKSIYLIKDQNNRFLFNIYATNEFLDLKRFNNRVNLYNNEDINVLNKFNGAIININELSNDNLNILTNLSAIIKQTVIPFSVILPYTENNLFNQFINLCKKNDINVICKLNSLDNFDQLIDQLLLNNVYNIAINIENGNNVNFDLLNEKIEYAIYRGIKYIYIQTSNLNVISNINNYTYIIYNANLNSLTDENFITDMLSNLNTNVKSKLNAIITISNLSILNRDNLNLLNNILSNIKHIMFNIDILTNNLLQNIIDLLELYNFKHLKYIVNNQNIYNADEITITKNNNNVFSVKDRGITVNKLALNIDASTIGFNADKVDGYDVNNNSNSNSLWTSDKINSEIIIKTLIFG